MVAASPSRQIYALFREEKNIDNTQYVVSRLAPNSLESNSIRFIKNEYYLFKSVLRQYNTVPTG